MHEINQEAHQHHIQYIRAVNRQIYSEISKIAKCNGVGVGWSQTLNHHVCSVYLLEEATIELPSALFGVFIEYRVVGPAVPLEAVSEDAVSSI